jgi:hypothetical protein
MSLGWRAAAADLIYSHVRVSYGLHLEEKRRFEYVANYLDVVTTLDPKFRAPYKYADTMLTLQAAKPRWQDYVEARRLLERGMENFPYDQELWTTAGQFLAYLAPAATEDPKVKEEWRLEGARRMARACELVSDNENLPFHCITAAQIFSAAGKREATRSFLERVLAVTEDEEIRRLALGYLEAVIGEQTKDEVAERVGRFEKVWRADLGFTKKDTLLIVGPPFDPYACAGLSGARSDACATSWRAWGEQDPKPPPTR